MKIAIASFLLLGAACAQDVCKVFSCGSITQTEGEADKCVSVQANNTDVTYDISTCTKDGEYCQAWEWNMVSQVSNSSVCGNTNYETPWPPQFTAAANSGLDGDICNSTAECYSSATNNATCESGVCKSSIAAGEACGITNDCPVSHYCPTDTKNCTVHVDDGANCTTVDQCDFRRSCIEIVTNGTAAANATCVAWGTLENGDTFTETLSGASNGLEATLSGSQVCKSAMQTTIDGTIQCRSGDRNKVQGRSDLEKTTVGESCETELFTNDTLAGFETSVNGTSLSICGFNQESTSWCPLLRGDEEVVKFVDTFVAVWNTIKCHKNTGISSGPSVCKAQQDAQGSDDGYKVYQYTVQTGSEVEFANTANNAKCVAETITSDFWLGQFTSAYTASVITSMCVLIASFIY